MRMNAKHLRTDDVIVDCLAIVDRCGKASGEGRYADGYRAASADIRVAIEARFGTRPMAEWEPDLRELEIEARTLSRVMRILRREQAMAPNMAVRNAITEIIRAIDEEEPESSVQVCAG